MVVVTHEMGFARDVANHVIFMDGGKIVEEIMPMISLVVQKKKEPSNFWHEYSRMRPIVWNI